MKKLGFGVMRMPLLNENDPTSFDFSKCDKMVDIFIENGFTHFDTAYVYHNGSSEAMIKKCVTDRYPRDKFTLSTKLPMGQVKSKADPARIFSEQLKNCGVEYFDYYLLHAINAGSYKTCVDNDCFNFGYEMQKSGKIKKFGFSFHDAPELLDKMLANHPVDFVLLQINYLDWTDPGVQARKCYSIALKYGVEILVMEPVKGGNLAKLSAPAEELFKSANPELSISSWAVRWAAGLEGVSMVLSGMSTPEQVTDNVSYMRDFHPLSATEHEILEDVIDIIRDDTAIKCTGCNYCTKGCPKNIDIPKCFSLYNDLKRSRGDGNSSQYSYYQVMAQSRGKASDCIGCALCEQVCPQKLEIRKDLVTVAKTFEGDAFWPSSRKNKN